MPHVPAPKMPKELDPKAFDKTLKDAKKKADKAKPADKAKLEEEMPTDEKLIKEVVKSLETLAKNHKEVDWEFFFRTMGPKQRKSPSDPQSKKVMQQYTKLAQHLQKMLTTVQKLSKGVKGNGPDGCLMRLTDAGKKLEREMGKAMKVDMSTSAI